MSSDATSANRAELAALHEMDRLSVVDAIHEAWFHDNGGPEAVLDALPALLREDSPVGDALRERLGLRWRQFPDGPDDIGGMSVQGMSGEPSTRWLASDKEVTS